MTVEASGLKSLRRKVESMQQDLSDEVNDEVRKVSEKTAADAKRNLAESNTFWTGNLSRSISARALPLVGGTRHEIAARVPYAAFVEYGTGARSDPTAPPKFSFGSPSPDDFANVFSGILPWVMGKPIFYGARTKGTAAAITHKIIRQGTHAHPFLRPAWFANERALTNRAGYAIRSVVRRS